MMWKEVFALVKHGNFSHADVNNLPVHERKFFINHLIQENEERQKIEKRELTKSKSNSGKWMPRKK
ncbi:MAG: hypothetical protein AABY22_27340 [Nanoarchaeota archaeon]